MPETKAPHELRDLAGLVLKQRRLKKELTAVIMQVQELARRIEADPALARVLRKLQTRVPKTPVRASESRR